MSKQQTIKEARKIAESLKKDFAVKEQLHEHQEIFTEPFDGDFTRLKVTPVRKENIAND